MSAKLIENLRRGQAVLSDQLLAEALTLSGALAVDDIASVMSACTAGELGDELVNRGYVSSAELSRMSAELDVATLMDSVGVAVPTSVRDASADNERRIGRYVLVDELGAGGMGVVWKAWDGKLSRWVAIKQVKVQEPQLIRRFMQEAKLLAGLTHPNITQVYEVGVHAGKPFLVMELVDGSTPGSQGAMGRQEAAAIVRDAARAVQYAHERGIVHRDLKPSNLLVSNRGRIFVTDFGLARMREEGSNLTQTGALLGTPSFMAPEQAQGKNADQRTDVYGLGATLYALVTGEPPYTGEIVHEIVKRVAISNPPTLLGNDDLVVVAQKAMERDREDRYTDAEALADDLERFLADESIAARPINSVERVWRRARRRPAFSLAIAATVLLAGGLASYAGLEFNSYLQRQQQISEVREPLAAAELLTSEIKRMFASGSAESSMRREAVSKLDQRANEALQLAPGYAPALFFKGLAATWSNDSDGAIAAFSDALLDDPDHLEARTRCLILELGKIPASPNISQGYDGIEVTPAFLDAETLKKIEIYETELNSIPEDYQMRLLAKSLLYGMQGQFAEQRDALQDYLVDYPYDSKARGSLAWALLSVGDYDGVDRAARDMLERHYFPNLARNLLALAHAGRNNYRAAIEEMHKSIEIGSNYEDYDWIYTWELIEGHADRALVVADSWIAAAPDSILARTRRTELALDMRLYERAVIDARSILTREPDNARGHYYLAIALQYSDPQAARQSFMSATADPDMAPHAFTELGSFELANNQAAAALLAFENALQYKELPRAYYGMHYSLLLLDRPNQAIAALEKLGDDPFAHSEIAAVAAANQQHAKAMSAIDKSIQLAPEQGIYQARKARFELAAGNTEQARQRFRRATEISPNDAEVYKEAIIAWRIDGDLVEAKSFASNWLSAMPDDPSASQALDELSAESDTIVPTLNDN